MPKESFFERIDELTQRSACFLPWTYQWKVRTNLTKGSVLDVGCGKGWAWRYFLRDKEGITFSVGIDICYEAITFCKNAKAYDDVILGDARFLPIRDKAFENALLLQIIEHLEKKDGLRLLKEAERISRSKIVVGTPVGSFLLGVFGHLSYWKHEELRSLGFKVYGYGFVFSFLKRFKNIKGSFSSFLMQIPRFLCLLPLPSYFFPKIGYQIVCIKEV